MGKMVVEAILVEVDVVFLDHVLGVASTDGGVSYIVVFLKEFRGFRCCFGSLGFVFDNASVIDSQMDFAWGRHGGDCPSWPIAEA